VVAGKMQVFKEFQIEAAHLLPNLPEQHKCRRLHGHSFRILVKIEGEIEPVQGWVMDFADISKAFQPIFNELDHHYLNEIAGLENPTSENLARWIWRKLKPDLPSLFSVQIKETCTSGCIYHGE